MSPIFIFTYTNCRGRGIEGVKKTRDQKLCVPEGGLEPPIFGLGDRRLIHWATRAPLGRVQNTRDLKTILSPGAESKHAYRQSPIQESPDPESFKGISEVCSFSLCLQFFDFFLLLNTGENGQPLKTA